MGWAERGVGGARLRKGAITVALVLGAGAAGTALAQTAPSAPSTITACVKKADGTTRLVSSGDLCKSNENIVTWNVQGPAGQDGQPGPAGPAGPAGLPGPEGLPGARSLGELEGTACAGPLGSLRLLGAMDIRAICDFTLGRQVASVVDVAQAGEEPLPIILMATPGGEPVEDESQPLGTRPGDPPAICAYAPSEGNGGRITVSTPWVVWDDLQPGEVYLELPEIGALGPTWGVYCADSPTPELAADVLAALGRGQLETGMGSRFLPRPIHRATTTVGDNQFLSLLFEGRDMACVYPDAPLSDFQELHFRIRQPGGPVLAEGLIRHLTCFSVSDGLREALLAETLQIEFDNADGEEHPPATGTFVAGPLP